MNGILNVAVGLWYPDGQDRLVTSLNTVGEKGAHRILWRGSWPGRSHTDCPYGFKVDAFLEAKKRGIGKALWCDSSVWAVKPLTSAWDYLDDHGVLLLGDGWNLGQWTSDPALEIFGVSRDEAMDIQLTYNCVVGIDLKSLTGRAFLSRWTIMRDVGAFQGSSSNQSGAVSKDPRCLGHRHDQSAAAWLAHDMAIPLAHLPTFLSIGPSDGDPVFRAAGM